MHQTQSSRYLIVFSYEKSAGRRHRQCFLMDKSCRKMYTILYVNRVKVTSWRLLVASLAAPSIINSFPIDTWRMNAFSGTGGRIATQFSPADAESTIWLGLALQSMGVARGGMRTTPLLGNIFEIDRENPLHRSKSMKLTVKIQDFLENYPFENPCDAPGHIFQIDTQISHRFRHYFQIHMVIELWAFRGKHSCWKRGRNVPPFSVNMLTWP
jgi:hypothetical protein